MMKKAKAKAKRKPAAVKPAAVPARVNLEEDRRLYAQAQQHVIDEQLGIGLREALRRVNDLAIACQTLQGHILHTLEDWRKRKEEL
jgi:hypothetical protein